MSKKAICIKLVFCQYYPCKLLSFCLKTGTLHTASFWDIIIQWTSHDDLTEKSGFFGSLAKRCQMTEIQNCFCWILSACSSRLRFQINLEAKSMHGSSWKKSVVSELTLFFPFYREWPQLVTILTSFDLHLKKKYKSLKY